MGSETRLGSYCTKRANNGVNLVTSRNINTRLARPIIASFGTVRAQSRFRSHVKSMGDFSVLQITAI